MAKKKPEKKKPLSTRTKDYIYISILFVTVFVFLFEAISKGGFNASDNLASTSFETYLETADEEGEFPLWVPYIFSGMPSYSAMLTTGERWWDFFYQIIFSTAEFFELLFNSDAARMGFWYALYGIGIYLLMRSKKKEQFVSFFSAFAAVFSTSVIVWIMIGHNTKPVVLACLPFAFMFVERLRVKFNLLYAILLVAALHTMFEAGHVQMIFYSALALGLYLIFELVSRLISKKEPLGVVKAAGILVVAGALAFVMSSDRYYPVLEYTEYSTRGTSSILDDKDNAKTESGGNPYDYATMWSFSPEETIDLIIPNFHGFGKLEYDVEENRGTILSRMASQYPDNKIPTYWGQKPFEDAAPYMGILIFFLGMFGILTNWRNIFVQFLAFMSLFALILSFGYTFPILYDFFFYNVPMFNKFRAPSMVLALVHFAFPILAGYGLSTIFQWRKNGITKEQKKKLNYLMISGGVFLVAAIFYNLAFEFNFKESVKNSDIQQVVSQLPQQYHGQVLNEYADFLWSEMIGDWFRNAILLLIGLGLIYLYAIKKISKVFVIAGLTIILAFDLWGVGSRRMEVRERPLEQAVFAEKDWVRYIKQDTSEKFRIADFVSPTPNASAYWLLENVNGYHSAKLRVYQDLLDVTSGGSTSNMRNPFMWNLLNVKYVIERQQMPGVRPVFESQQSDAKVYLNPTRLPRAFFVDSIAYAEPIEILNKMKYQQGQVENFNPREVVYLEDKLNTEPNIEKADTSASVEILEYKNEYIKMDVNASGNNFLLLSEIYYPKWRAYIDGEETDIIKSNYAFRGLIVPEGEHTIELKMINERFETGKTASLATNIVLILALIASFYMERKNKKKE